MNSSGDGTSYGPSKIIDTLADTGCVGTMARFDPFEEILWVGANEGYLQGYQGSCMTQYSAFNTLYGGALTDFCVTDAGPFAVTSNGLTQYNRTGATLFSPMTPTAAEFNCCLAIGHESTFASNGTIILAGNKGLARKISADRPDRAENLVISDIDTVLLRASDRFLCFGSANGEVTILDLRSGQNRKHLISQKPVALYDFDIHDYSLFSCLYETDQNGGIIPSCSISAYDLRVCKSTSPIIASLSPSFIRFLPNSYGHTCIVADSEGKYELVDSVATSSIRKNPYHLDTIGGVPFSMDVSTTGRGIAIVDTSGSVHILSSAVQQKGILWTDFSRVSNDVHPVVVHQVASDTLFQPRQPFSNAQAAGHLPYREKMLTTGFLKSPELCLKHSAIHRSISYTGCSTSPTKSFNSFSPNKMSTSWEQMSDSSLSLAVLEPISLYLHINPVLQALFGIKSVSAFFQSHVCFDEFCLTCELGFLFHMLAVQGSEDSCQATNLVRVLRALPDATARGLISTGQDELNVGTSVQNWMDFLLERTHNEYLHHTGYHEAQDSPVTGLCAWKVMETVMHECGHVNQLEKFVYCLPLQYSVSHECIGQDLHSILRTTLNEQSEWLLTCSYCQQPTNSYISRNILTMPECLTLSFNLEDNSNRISLKYLVDAWIIRQTLSREKRKTPLASDVKRCRYGASCTRPNCFFLHPNEVESEQGSEDAEPTFIPSYLWARIDVHGRAEVVNHQPVDSHAWSCYEALTVVYENVGDRKKIKSTVATMVKVRTDTASEAVWQCFEDLSVTSTTQCAALSFDLNFKVPCLVQYVRFDVELRWPTRVVSPITREIFQKFCDLTSSRRAYQTSSVISAQLTEVFNHDSLVALDAEFVSLAGEEVDIPSAVAASNAKPSVLSVGRVTVLRGNGPLTDTLLMDEYVVARDKIGNHLTEFSGIRPGDLSANLSLKRLDTLKSVYVRVRYLVDAGVCFIGHGIHTDFRILNIRVPADQIIDTVQLYRLPDQRLISLKFLSWYFLGNHIQHQHGHDSAEDALTSLRLFNLFEKYRSLSYTDNSSGNGCTFVDLLAQMYELGRSLAWKVPPQNP